MTDALVLIVLLIAFATFLTTHVAIAVRLLLRKEDRWRDRLAWLAPPLAPLWAFRRGWRISAVIWVVSLVVYVIALIVALR